MAHYRAISKPRLITAATARSAAKVGSISSEHIRLLLGSAEEAEWVVPEGSAGFGSPLGHGGRSLLCHSHKCRLGNHLGIVPNQEFFSWQPIFSKPMATAAIIDIIPWPWNWTSPAIVRTPGKRGESARIVDSESAIVRDGGHQGVTRYCTSATLPFSP